MGWLKKLKKKAKNVFKEVGKGLKVAKDLAPLAAMVVPGLQPLALAGLAGKAAGAAKGLKGLKGALAAAKGLKGLTQGKPKDNSAPNLDQLFGAAPNQAMSAAIQEMLDNLKHQMGCDGNLPIPAIAGVSIGPLAAEAEERPKKLTAYQLAKRNMNR